MPAARERFREARQFVGTERQFVWQQVIERGALPGAHEGRIRGCYCLAGAHAAPALDLCPVGDRVADKARQRRRHVVLEGADTGGNSLLLLATLCGGCTVREPEAGTGRRRLPTSINQQEESVIVRLVVAAAASFLMITGTLSQDGARAYHLLPQGTDILSLTATQLHATREPGEIVLDVGVLTPAYRHSVDIFGNAGAILIGMPFGNLSTSFSTMGGTVELDTDLAQGDLFVGGVLGLLGSPSLSPLEYSQYKPGLRASVATKLFLPTGAYDSSTPLNIGGNRWSLQASLPVSYVLGDTMIDPTLTTFEIMPVVHIFGDNGDPFGGASVTSQDPIFALEGHITRNFSPTVWAALDGFYGLGGETSADGVRQGNAKEELALGVTLGLSLAPSFVVRLSYEELVHSNVPNSSARRFELTSAYLF